MKIIKFKFFLVFSLLVTLVSCQEQEFYEKEFLEGAGVEKPAADGTGSGNGGDNNSSGNGGDNNGPGNGGNNNAPGNGGNQPGVCGNGTLQSASDTFTQNSARSQKVDILWVIDNSGSMKEEQENLARNFDVFIQDFIQKEIDFKMAITTTDPRTRFNGVMVGDPKNLTSAAAAADEAKFLADFSNYVQVGIRGSGSERGLRTSASFITKYPAFVRNDALLVVVYLSDEQDQSNPSVDNYLQGFQSLKSNAGHFKAFSIVLLPTDTAQNRWETVGTRYIDLAVASGGSASSIKEDFHTVLGNIGGTIVDLLSSFPLSGIPANASIKVKVNGVVLNSGWSYDKATRSITFENGSVPDAGSIVIVYYYECGGS